MSADNWYYCPQCQPTGRGGELLREDYEIGFYRGEFRVDYLASCERCGFKYKYSITQQPQFKTVKWEAGTTPPPP